MTDCQQGITPLFMARVCVFVGLASTIGGCDKMLESKEAQHSFSVTTIRMVYADLQTPISDEVVSKAVDKVDAIANTMSLEDKFRCSYETYVVADLARKRAGKPSFPETGRLTDDDLDMKAATDSILLSDQLFQTPPVGESFLSKHIAEYAVPSDTDAVFLHAIWRTSFLRSVASEVGVTGPKADRWLNKGRSKEPVDRRFRQRANMGVGERRCYDLVGMRPPGEPSKVDMKALADRL